jgi:hypothetical protein
MRRILSFVAAAALVAPGDSVLAQFSPGARSVGMGGAGMVYARGVDAIEWNPANLALDGGWNIALGEVGASALVTGADIQALQDLFEEEGTDASAAVNDLPASGLALATVGEGYAILPHHRNRVGTVRRPRSEPRHERSQDEQGARRPHHQRLRSGADQ